MALTREYLEQMTSTDVSNIMKKLDEIDKVNKALNVYNEQLTPLLKLKEDKKEELDGIFDNLSNIDEKESPLDYKEQLKSFYNKNEELKKTEIEIKNLQEKLEKYKQEKNSIQIGTDNNEVEKEEDFGEAIDRLGDELIRKHEESSVNEVFPDNTKESENEEVDFGKLLDEFGDDLKPRKDAFKMDENSAIAKTEKKAIEPAKEALQNQSRMTSDGKSVLIAKNPKAEEPVDSVKTIDEIIDSLKEEKEKTQSIIDSNNGFDIDDFMNNTPNESFDNLSNTDTNEKTLKM